MTETSAVPLAIETAGWSLGKMSADLVRAAAARGGHDRNDLDWRRAEDLTRHDPSNR